MKRGRPKKLSTDPTLSQLGISRTQSAQWQKLAAIPKEQFEKALTESKNLSTAEILRMCGQARRVKAATIPLCPHCGQPLPVEVAQQTQDGDPSRDGAAEERIVSLPNIAPAIRARSDQQVRSERFAGLRLSVVHRLHKAACRRVDMRVRPSPGRRYPAQCGRLPPR